MIRPVQYFTAEYLEQCRKLSADEIIKFLDQYQKLLIDPGKLTQINLRVPRNILKLFKAKAANEGLLYQTKIKELMLNWVLDSTIE